MELRLNQLAAHLERTLAPIYVVHGDEPLQAIEAGDAIRAAARRAGCDEREVLVAETGFKWDAFLAANANLGLFGTRKLVDLRIPSGKPGVDGAQGARSLRRARQPRSDPARHAAEARSRDAGLGVVLGARRAPASPSPSIRWSATRFPRGSPRASRASGSASRRRRSPFSPTAAKATCSRRTRKSKSSGLLLPEGELDADAVERAVTDVARYDVFQLSEAWLAADAARALRIIAALEAEGEGMPLLLWQLGEDIHALASVQEAMAAGTPAAVAVRNARVWGKRQAAMERAARRVTPRGARSAHVGARAARCAREGHRPRQRLGRAPHGRDDARGQCRAAASVRAYRLRDADRVARTSAGLVAPFASGRRAEIATRLALDERARR